jgi:general secretion pathway protein K
MARRFLPSHRARRGVALLSVLWLVALMGVLSLGLLALARNDRLAAHAALNAARAQSLADAGVYLAIHQLNDAKTRNEIPVDGRERDEDIDGHPVVVSVQDEGGKIDVNFCTVSMLKSALLSAGLAAEESTRIANVIDDKRKAAQQSANDAHKLTADWMAQTVPFRTVEELKSISGISEAVYEKLRQVLTVYAQTPIVQVLTAPEPVLYLLPGVETSRVQKELQERKDKLVTAADIGMMGPTQDANMLLAHVFTIRVTAKDGTASFTRRAVVLMTGNSRDLYKVLVWSADHF